MPSCTSKYRFVMVRISNIMSKTPEGRWRLILKAGKVQIGRFHLGVPSWMSKFRFVWVRTLIFMTKVMSGTWIYMKAYLSVTSLAVSGWPLGSASRGLQVPNIIFYLRIEILTLTNLYLDIQEGIPKGYLPSCTWLASRISFQRPPGARHYFLLKNWNPGPKKPIFRHTWRHT